MIEWLETVRDALDLEVKTLFQAVFIMDKYLFGTWDNRQGYSKTYLYLVGITSIFIASKYEEVCPLSVVLAERDLGHNKFS